MPTLLKKDHKNKRARQESVPLTGVGVGGWERYLSVKISSAQDHVSRHAGYIS